MNTDFTRELATAVRNMRELQKRYFKTAHGNTDKLTILKRSKEAEYTVDRMLKQYFQSDEQPLEP